MSNINVVAAGSEATRNGDSAEPGSVLATVRAAAARARESKHIDLPVGGSFGGRLVLRYRALPVDDLERYSELAGRITNVALAIDMMVACCETVVWREHGTDTDLGVRLTSDLWLLLDWPLPAGIDEPAELTPRELVAGLFESNAMRLGEHVEQLVGWMRETEEPALGEAPGVTS